MERKCKIGDKERGKEGKEDDTEVETEKQRVSVGKSKKVRHKRLKVKDQEKKVEVMRQVIQKKSTGEK